MDVQKLEAANPTLAKQVEQFANKIPAQATMGRGRLECTVQRYDFLSPDSAYVFLDPSSFEREVEQIYEKNLSTWIILRNVSSILPLLWTWLTLFLASNAYTAYIAAHAGQPNNQTSFFVLWQNGFENRTYSFSIAAAVDFAVLLIFLFLTIVVNHIEQTDQQKTATFSRELQSVTTQLVGFIAEKGGIALPPGANVQTVAEAVNRACAQALQASKQIADDARKHIDDAEKRVDTLVTQLSHRLGEVQAQMKGLTTATADLVASANTLATGSTALANSAGQYLQIGQGLQSHLQSLNKAETDVSQQLGKISAGVTAATDGFTNAIQSVKSVSSKIDQEMTQGVQQMTANITQASALLAKTDRTLSQTQQALGDTSQDLTRSGRSIEDASHQFEQALRVAGYASAPTSSPTSVWDWLTSRGRRRRANKAGTP